MSKAHASETAQPLSARARAAQVLVAVMGGSALDGPLERARERIERADDRGLLAALCFGALRHYYGNRALVRAMLAKPNQKLQRPVEALLILGIEQLEHLRVAPHAAVAETVAAARELKLKGATGLINALLRRFTREREALLAGLDGNEVARFQHPQWLLEVLRRDWPQDWQAIVEHNNRPAPMWLRVNLARGTREDYIDRLTALPDTKAHEGAFADSAVCVTPARPVAQLPGFEAGDVAVQDHAAQLARHILAPLRGQRVLDACAAPGGKAAHLLEAVPGIELVAVDNASPRLARLKENFRRQGLSAQVECRDLTDATQLQGLGRFQRILLDVPCTGTGVIRRHPDIKLLRRQSDAAQLAQRQGQLLANAFSLLEAGGRLVYATCSVLREENDGVIGAFLAANADVASITLEGEWGRAASWGRQILPGEGDADGFYYACLEKHQGFGLV